MKFYSPLKTLLPLLLMACLLPSSVLAANFTLSPVRLFFPPGQKTDIINIKNNSTEEIKLQVSTFSWSQDDSTKDVLTETEDLIAFPKLLSVAPGETRLLRVGSRTNAGNNEKLYRLYIEELPDTHEVTGNQASVRTLTKAGIPVFIRPHLEQVQGAIRDTSLEAGAFKLSIENTGNVHFMIRSVRAKGIGEAGNTVFEREAAGWYLHPSQIKAYSLDVPRQDCLKMRAIEAEVMTNSFSRSERLNVVASMCGA